MKLHCMRTIYHGISNRLSDLRFSPAPPTQFAFQGRLVTTKGMKLVLRAAENILSTNKDFHITIVGDGPERENLELQMTDQLRRHVRFLGHVSEQQIDEVLKDASVVIMPSLGGEVFGLVAAENMLRGKLLIVSDIGAMREVVGETGLVFRTGDAEDLATCMKRVITEPDLAIRLGASARRRATLAFDRDSMIEAHMLLYEGALSR